MLYWLLLPLGDTFSGFNVFRYLTFRTGLAIATAFFISLVVGPWLIDRLRVLQVRQAIREEGPAHHQAKAGTPTMGGLLIVSSIVISTLLKVSWYRIILFVRKIMEILHPARSPFVHTIGSPMTGFGKQYTRR